MQPFSSTFQALKQLRQPLWYLFLISGPTIYFSDHLFDWLNETYRFDTLCFVFFYYLTLLILLFSRDEFYFTPFLFLAFFSLALDSTLPDYVTGIAFKWYIYPEVDYVQEHCHPVKFKQDTKIYQLGLCDLKIDKDGQADFAFLYDTSGDAAEDTDYQDGEGQNRINRRDRIEWVDAIRQIFNDDPNEGFEIADFYTLRICKYFYRVDFDNSDAAGFTREYGPPPPNPKNHYASFF